VIVFLFDRWGRDGAEWLTRVREFERLGVPIISVQEGKDEGGLIRFMRAGMAEEYSRQLAKRVRPGRETSAREGVHMGPTPLGYVREYPPPLPNGKRPAGKLVEDPRTAGIVQELFRRYAAGGWSHRSLAMWLNTDPLLPTREALGRGESQWDASTVRKVLGNPVYAGRVRFNLVPVGVYERAAKDACFEVTGLHDALIDQATFDRVQERHTAARARPSYNHARPDTELGAGLFTCAGCGGPMTVSRTMPTSTAYKCLRRMRGQPCTAPGYSNYCAHDALLTEVRRLRGAPWTPQVETRMADNTRHQEAIVLQQALADARTRLRKHSRLVSLMDDDPTPEQIADFREVSREISQQIRSLEAQLAAMETSAAQMPDLRALHLRLTQTEIPMLIDALVVQDDRQGLRDLVQDLVQCARIVERVPASHARWLRAEVTWTPDIQLLLEHKLLTLDTPKPTSLPRDLKMRHAAHPRPIG
jgi:Recombinase/Resolvase, N terminal domain